MPSRLESYLDAFEAAWQQPLPPRLEDYLPAETDPERQAVLVGLVRIDLERRIKSGETIRIERYLERFPELSAPDVLLKLVLLEHRLRRRHDPAFDAAEYPGRFPALASQLKIELQTVITQDDRPARGESSSPEGAGLDLREYELLDRVGRGGMGEVFRGKDPALGRDLAVKVLRPELREDRDAEGRFAQEARLTGALQHPNIVPIHNLGRLPDGRLYFTMKLVRGRTLAEILAEGSGSGRQPELLGLFEKVCQAVAFAHSRGVIHRDLKPENVMVGAFGEVQVMDWGLAKVLYREEGAGPLAGEGAEASDTLRRLQPVGSTADDRKTGVVGTLAYMPPEQARGKTSGVDERADVFGLGAILCVLLTGQPPYLGSDLLAQAQQGALAGALGRLDACGADSALVTLAKRCLAPDVAERPRHAGLVAEAVAEYQARVQERLRQAELERTQAQVKAAEERKRRRLALALAASLLVLVTGAAAAGLWYQYQEALWTEEQAQQEKEQALRLAQTGAGVRAALKEATTLADRAQTQLPQPEAWKATLDAAFTALRQAETLLTKEPALGGGEWPAQVRQLRARLEADAKDWQLLAEYDQVRLEQSQWDLQRRRFKLAESYSRLQKALADYGLVIGGLEADKAAAQLRQRPLAVQLHLRAVLEECLARVPQEQSAQRQWLTAVLAPEADPWLKQFRQAVAKRDWAEVELLVGQADVSRYHPAVLVGLEASLRKEAGASGVLLLRRTQQQYPGDFWVNLELGVALYRSVFPAGADRPARAKELPMVNEAVTFGRVAVGLRPGNAPAHNNLGLALAAQGDVKGAIACFTKALDLDPKLVPAHTNLGLALQAQGDVKGAITCYHKALTLDPECVQAHTNLGLALQAQGDVKGAIACFTKALDLDPKYALAHTNLANALADQGDVKGAIACYHKALDLDPECVQAHNNLGLALKAQGDVKGAIACYKKALDLAPELAPAHTNLGTALQAQGDVKGAIACYHKALALDPKHTPAHYNLGIALKAQGDLDGAIACYKKALALDPKDAEAHCNLGHVLRAQGHFAQALQALKRGHEIGSKQADWRYPSPQWVQDCQRLLELDARLTAILGGDDQPKDSAEQLALADLCQRYKKRYAAAARFYADAFAAGSAVTTKRGYNAACAATLAAAGKGEDAAKLDPKDKTRLRQQALTWLRNALELHTTQLETADAKARAALQQTLRHWQQDADLASLREDKALAQLPEAERAAWQQLWADVAALLKRAEPK
jgi:tetratricopeptide (TPR) repeat protein